MADHANNLALKIRNNLTNSMKALGVDILTGVGTIVVSRQISKGTYSSFNLDLHADGFSL